MFRSTPRTNFYNSRLPAARIPHACDFLTRREIAALIIAMVLAYGALFVGLANASTVAIPINPGATVSGGVCPDEALSVSIPSGVRTVRSSGGPVRYRNTTDRVRVVRIECAPASRSSRGRPVSAYDAARTPDTAALVQPGGVWHPAPCIRPDGVRTFRYSDLSAYRSNGRPLGGQEWVGDEQGRAAHALAWSGNTNRRADAYVYYYAHGWDDNGRPYFVNNTARPIIAAAWCG